MSDLPTLYELEAQYRELMALDLPEEELADTLEAIDGTLEVKRQRIGHVLQSLDAAMAAMQEAEERMKERRAAVRRRKEWLERYLIESMRSHGITKIECPEWSMSLVQNPPRTEIDDADSIPLTYMRVIPESYEPDKKTIKEAIEEGRDVPGAHLERGWRLRIK